MPEISLPDWNAFLAKHPDAHLLQSGEWGELKSAFGWEAVRIVEGDCGAQILFRRLPLGFAFGYLPKGPVGSSRPGPAFWAAVDQVCRQRRAVFLKVEQDGWQGSAGGAARLDGFVPSPQHIQPASTLVIELDGREDEIFERMKPKTRYNIRLAGRKEVVVHPSDDIEAFYRVMGVTSQRRQFHVHSLEYYRRAYEFFHPGGLCELFVADYQGRSLATVMVFAYGKQAYYFYGASSDEDRNRKPTYPLQWEAIRWAHQRGCSEYDMWGIPDDVKEDDESESDEREDGLWGVYRFKKGFGGAIKRALPPLDRVYNPLLYKLYLWRFSGSGAD
ncbi:MAG TPA: peptidoglycan bridge formation glycyltransferase FemA/FemB family protein [Anaerolineales bacterium]|nr:peptidoglycan bridge formation glycyltransferase FemA/FemB family protein [Anaerolineales bacterium]